MTTLDATALTPFLAADPGGPVVMLNLLRFTPDGGAARYQDYLAKFSSSGIQERYGVEIVYGGAGGAPLVAPAGQDWDMVALVRYPSRQHFVDMVDDPDYLRIEHLRTEALVEAVLQPTQQVM